MVVGIVFCVGYFVAAVVYERKPDVNTKLVTYYRELSHERGEALEMCRLKLKPQTLDGNLTGTWFFKHDEPEFCFHSIDPERGPVYYCYELPKTFTALSILDALDKGFGRPHYVSR